MCELINKLKPHVNRMVEDTIDVIYQLGCVIAYGLGLDEFFEAINDE